ncbi:hypothetical protein [Paracoccus homiensis]|uniref:Uncharacterized protein n=1 Tax=Paracoccus homiensis TaxID=364199 RepID=A0A1H9Y9V2_9RHOB|nr:hypothetical protein [Paracoccus homiensis]SES65722.1 hypothetical protein SAMN04489858_10191 [Paracoccus homiensis]
MLEQAIEKIIEAAFSPGGATALASAGGWLLFFWSEWRRDRQAARFSDKITTLSSEAHASQLATVKVLEGFRSDLVRRVA